MISLLIPTAAELAECTADFVRRVIVPIEAEHSGILYHATDELRLAMRANAREAGVSRRTCPPNGEAMVSTSAVISEAAG